MCVCVWWGGGGGGGVWLSYRWLSEERALGKSQILVDRDGSTCTFVNVAIVTDSQHGVEMFRGAGGGGCLAVRGAGQRPSRPFIPLSLPLSYLLLSLPVSSCLFLSLPGSGGLLT